jgi:hypothetical protein
MGHHSVGGIAADELVIRDTSPALLLAVPDHLDFRSFAVGGAA